MSLAILLGLLVVLVAVAFVLYPLLRPALGRAGPPDEPPTEDDLAARRLQLYREIVDLDFDLQVGKLSPTDYQQLRAELLRQAADLLREQDQSEAALDQAIEAEVTAIRRARAARRATACWRCGRPFGAEDAFCGRCGTPRAADAVPAGTTEEG